MSPAIDNLVLDHICAIRATVDRLAEDMQELKSRLGLLEQHCASLSNRLDRIDRRILRIEKRLDLVDS
jgi:predicted RNase H-like nuclease (RuvC/YqgF family)